LVQYINAVYRLVGYENVTANCTSPLSMLQKNAATAGFTHSIISLI